MRNGEAELTTEKSGRPRGRASSGLGERQEQAEFLRGLRAARASAFRGEIVPYFRYVFQSGFGLFASACLFAAFIWYVDLIKAVPEDWPVKTVGIAALTAAAVWAPLRTYMQAADTIFLLPMEAQLLRHYVGPAVRGAVVAGGARALAVFALYAPIYDRSPAMAGVAPENPAAFAALALLVACVGSLNVYAGWRERQLASAGWRISLRVARWALTAAAVGVLLLKPLAWSVPFLALCAAIPWLLWRSAQKHALPMERLVQEEEAIRRRWMGFLGWFVDVRSESAKAYPRRWIAWIGERIDWRQSKAWHYLYALTLLRSETFGALFRWTLIAAGVLAVSVNAIADAVIYAIAVLVAGMQLSELKRLRFVETADALPIAPEGRHPAAASVARVAGVSVAALLAVVAAATAGGAFSAEYGLTAFAAGLLWTGWLVPRRIAKRSEDED
ncbi:ABC transporter permease [Cohnella sp. GCM10027633]|uniref:ABC transporter permease n=1 Tax=unclassified Cohnella TaxID=2636738 RepID=UPI00363EAAF1